MRFVSSPRSLSLLVSPSDRWQILSSIVTVAAFSAFVPASAIAAADEAEVTSQTENADSDSELSDRQRRRAERRRERDEADSNGNTFASVEADDASVTNGNAPEIVVLVEPQMECRKITVVGSRVPKQVCTPVALDTETGRRQEADAEEFLRRTRERSTTNGVSTTGQEQSLSPSLFD